MRTSVHNGHEAVDTFLLDRGADPSLPDNSGRTPLMAGAMKGCLAMMELLLQRGAVAGLARHD